MSTFTDEPTPADQGAAMQALAEESPEAVGLVSRYLAQSERERTRIEEYVEESRQREIAEWRERALWAEAELRVVRGNFYMLLNPSHAEITDELRS